MSEMVVHQGGDGPSVLGENPPSLQIAGMVRPGVMVLTREFQENQLCRQVYERGVAAGVPWSQISEYLRKKLKLTKNPLTMKNAPFFYVKKSDFKGMPEIAGAIMDRYAEPRREDDEFELPGLERRLYRFPIIFPLDTWLGNLPHGFVCWSQSARRYWSRYVGLGADAVRMCMMHAPIEVDPRSRRAPRPWGGRPVQYRPENGGRCDPSICQQYQNEECNLGGRLLFYVPEVPGGSLLAVPTDSWYSLNAMRSVLMEVLAVRGRLSGWRDDGEPLFWLTKETEEISRIDRAAGKPIRQKQHLIKLYRNFDITAVLEHGPSEDPMGTPPPDDTEPPPMEGEWMPDNEEDEQ